ncbi:DNA repair protein RAD9 [Schizosaccharomyces cryophilus OY26]|uniref:DNA repair protein RAD9 n=1 Tax=Schizosaccharomyces cryophilus (strain OY26 / ATCC MYA-4695 / CBS 11777 / NBRC 106824 / NRRL Y48691) TaxID=653667 RepID=S9X005_SCHCR|nr:DNA repair protein RAD9 [Schizosaccharomyces cryophilus OY26]EPY50287.1 DNA repair protein RAD9 [Schizosaccharomyces cryophilus OY26]
MQISSNPEFAEHKSSSQQAYPLHSVAYSPVRLSSVNNDLKSSFKSLNRNETSSEDRSERIRNSFENVDIPVNENDGLGLTQLFEVPTQVVETKEIASESSGSSDDEIIIQNPSSGSQKASTPNRAERVLEQLYNQQGALSQQKKIVSPQSFPNSPELLSPPGSTFPASMTSTLKDTPVPHSSNEQATGNVIEDILVPDTVAQERRYYDYPVGSLDSEADAGQIESTPTRRSIRAPQLALITGIESTPPTKFTPTESDHDFNRETKQSTRQKRNIISDTPISSRILVDVDSLNTRKRKAEYTAENEFSSQSPLKADFDVPRKHLKENSNVFPHSDAKTNNNNNNYKEMVNSPELGMESEPIRGKFEIDKPRYLLPDLKKFSNSIHKIENRVLAFFKGYPAFYYPATVLCQTMSTASGIPQFKIQFDDSTASTVNVNQLKRFELKEGDIVRSTALRLNHTVLRAYHSTGENTSIPPTDAFGNDMVSLRIGKQDEVAVPMSTIYLIPSQIRKFKDRDFQLAGRSNVDTDSNYLPSSSSISRKRPMCSYTVNDDGEEANQVTMTESKKVSIFHDCIFVFTGLNTVDDKERSLLINSVKYHGGTVLDEGLSSLYCNYYNGKGKILFPLKPHKRSKSWNSHWDVIVSNSNSGNTGTNVPVVDFEWIIECVISYSDAFDL